MVPVCRLCASQGHYFEVMPFSLKTLQGKLVILLLRMAMFVSCLQESREMKDNYPARIPMSCEKSATPKLPNVKSFEGHYFELMTSDQSECDPPTRSVSSKYCHGKEHGN